MEQPKLAIVTVPAPLAEAERLVDVYTPKQDAPRGEYAALLRYGTGRGWEYHIRFGFGRNAREACGQIEASLPGAHALKVMPICFLDAIKGLRAEYLNKK